MSLVLKRTAVFVAFVLMWALVAAAVTHSADRQSTRNAPATIVR